MDLKEIWKDIKGYEGYYQVSNLGRVKSLTRSHKSRNRWGNIVRKVEGQFMLGFFDRNGYKRVSLAKNNKTKKHFVHRLVALAFIPNPQNKETINHKNPDKNLAGFNYVTNLEWATILENNRHARKHISQKVVQGEGHPSAKANELLVKLIRYEMRPRGLTYKDIGERVGLTRSAVALICRGERWKHV